ncbi:MAG: hypothetical protein CVU89_03395 [Firmicutes bacterium HGW-Firmicutes-14]|nr:MAG: hypothetical protein CVU89_03395 [Firmicutes bacterium HGW-Firmicutes-14]
MGRQSKEQWQFKTFESRTKTAKHLRITNNMIESPAWQNLSCYAITVYVHMKAKYNFSNQDDISMTYEEAKKLMAKATFSKAIDELIETGFIQLIRQSWTARQPNIYSFSEMWQQYGTDNFKIQKRRKRDSEFNKPKPKTGMKQRSRAP